MEYNYPSSLKEELTNFGVKPTGNVEWDRELLHLCQQRKKEEAQAVQGFGQFVERAEADRRRTALQFDDLTEPAVFKAHQRFLLYIANEIVLRPQRRRFEIDDDNRQVLRFLLYYFNDCPLAEDVFPGRGYKLHKNIMLQGGVGVGKTMLMQIFSEYLRRRNNPRFFYNVSVTQMVNYYSIHNNIDRFLYNEEESRGFAIKPYHLCLNDIGVENRPFYGIDTLTIINDFLHARNEIWTNGDIDRRFAHLTTNLTTDQLAKKFSQKDAFGRIVDRFKTYNIIPVTGTSRR